MDYPDFAGEMSRLLAQGWLDTVAAATVTGIVRLRAPATQVRQEVSGAEPPLLSVPEQQHAADEERGEDVERDAGQ
jgi:hypothetical protein